MKIIVFSLGFIFLFSCAPIYNYQVLKTDYTGLKKIDNLLVFEDEHCSISYNLWSENGMVKFLFHNKTDSIIEIDKSASFFILNGIANDYFLNRTVSSSTGVIVTNSKSTIHSSSSTQNMTISSSDIQQISRGTAASRSIALSNSAGNDYGNISGSSLTQSKNKSVEYVENEIVRVPPNSSKVLGEYNLLKFRIKDCDLKKTPTYKEKIDSVVFSKENSPLIFDNVISYSILGNTSERFTLKHSFYVNKIMNMLYDEFFVRDYYIGCNGKQSLSTYDFMRYEQPNSFYIKYSRE